MLILDTGILCKVIFLAHLANLVTHVVIILVVILNDTHHVLLHKQIRMYPYVVVENKDNSTVFCSTKLFDQNFLSIITHTIIISRLNPQQRHTNQ